MPAKVLQFPRHPTHKQKVEGRKIGRRQAEIYKANLKDSK